MGRVSSGIVTYSRFRPWQAWRYRYNTSFPWPTSLAMLKRCFMVQKFPLGNGKELLIVNLHNSTFDDKGQLRLEELKELGSFLETEYMKGNYVVTGGDWNMNPRGSIPGRSFPETVFINTASGHGDFHSGVEVCLSIPRCLRTVM